MQGVRRRGFAAFMPLRRGTREGDRGDGDEARANDARRTLYAYDLQRVRVLGLRCLYRHRGRAVLVGRRGPLLGACHAIALLQAPRRCARPRLAARAMAAGAERPRPRPCIHSRPPARRDRRQATGSAAVRMMEGNVVYPSPDSPGTVHACRGCGAIVVDGEHPQSCSTTPVDFSGENSEQ